MNAQLFAISFLGLLALANATPADSCPEVDGELATILGNDDDCSSFYICANGTPYLFQCPAGLEFNNELDVCDWPESAACVVVTTTTRRPRTTTTTRRPRTTTTQRSRTTTTTRRSRPRLAEE